ncbi:HEAT repeat domain-containing protein [Candidatus Peregrinibacteria bacterium]|nr:HEAT repeat domain-containing protein [Candidatus Peregrinibacteria bacterium]
MNCEDINIKFLDYLDNNLNSIEKEQVENHLAKCSLCAIQLEQFKKLNKLLIKAKEVQSSQAFNNDFAEMLESEKSKMSKQYFRLNSIKSSLKIAASILIFIAGSVFGIFMQNYNLSTTKISHLESQLSSLKQQVAFEILSENKSASEKLTAINIVSEQNNLDMDIANALYNTIISDENSSVRIEAAITLQQFSNDNDIKMMLINALEHQDDPVVQIKLIQILSSFKENNAKNALKLFFEQEELLPVVKEYGQRML